MLCRLWLRTVFEAANLDSYTTLHDLFLIVGLMTSSQVGALGHTVPRHTMPAPFPIELPGRRGGQLLCEGRRGAFRKPSQGRGGSDDVGFVQ